MSANIIDFGAMQSRLHVPSPCCCSHLLVVFRTAARISAGAADKMRQAAGPGLGVSLQEVR